MERRFLSLYCPDIAADRLTHLVEWCDRYSPLVAKDGEDSLILDITGCTHLLGGEGPLLLDLQRRLRRAGIESRAAIADTWSVAWALAHYGNRLIVRGEAGIAALNPLPVEALRIPDEIVSELHRLGILKIAALKKIPRHSLAARFGSPLLRRFDQAFCNAKEPLNPWRPPAPYRVSRILGEPVSTVSCLEYVLNDLIQEICAKLRNHHTGARCMDLACYRVDGTLDRCEVRTSKPTRSLPHLMRLFGERLSRLKAGFGFEAFVLSIPDVEALHPAQLSISETTEADDEESFDALVDRLGMRLGFEHVNRIQLCESYLPEASVKFQPATSPAPAEVEWPAYRTRPIRLITPPMRIEVSALFPGGAPVQFFIGQQRHRVIHSEGPERLNNEWWRESGKHWTIRDYYRVEDDGGFRFWIFCDESSQWFLHGHFA